MPEISHKNALYSSCIVGLTPRGINGLCQSLRSSPKILESLTHLNLSGNMIKGEEAEVKVAICRTLVLLEFSDCM